MKSSVDLTQDRAFSGGLRDFVFNPGRGHFPWNYITLREALYLRIPWNRVRSCGEIGELMYSIEHGYHCARCGKQLHIWDSSSRGGLCFKCDEEVSPHPMNAFEIKTKMPEVEI